MRPCGLAVKGVELGALVYGGMACIKWVPPCKLPVQRCGFLKAISTVGLDGLAHGGPTKSSSAERGYNPVRYVEGAQGVACTGLSHDSIIQRTLAQGSLYVRAYMGRCV